MLPFFSLLLPRQRNTTMNFTYCTVEIFITSSSVIAHFVAPDKWRWYHKRCQKPLSQETEEEQSNQCMLTAERWQQSKLGVYLMNFCKTSQQGYFSDNTNMLKSGEIRKREERRIIHSVLFGRTKWSVLAHWRITQNTSTLSCAVRGVNAKKSPTTSRVTELRLKIKYSRRKLRCTCTQIDSTLFFNRKNVGGSARNCLIYDQYIHIHTCSSNRHLKSSSRSNSVKHVFVLTIPF